MTIFISSKMLDFYFAFCSKKGQKRIGLLCRGPIF